jgi:hypothetical protein
MIERIVYVSRSAPGIGPREAYDIVRVSHNRNSQRLLTGALIFLDGHFLQVLEGEGYHVRERLAVIAADTRHTGLVVRQSLAAPQRAFAGDWMALREGDGIDPATLQALGYAPGFPDERIDGDRLLAFAKACCRAHVQGEAVPS